MCLDCILMENELVLEAFYCKVTLEKFKPLRAMR